MSPRVLTRTSHTTHLRMTHRLSALFIHTASYAVTKGTVALVKSTAWHSSRDLTSNPRETRVTATLRLSQLRLQTPGIDSAVTAWPLECLLGIGAEKGRLFGPRSPLLARQNYCEWCLIPLYSVRSFSVCRQAVVFVTAGYGVRDWLAGKTYSTTSMLSICSAVSARTAQFSSVRFGLCSFSSPGQVMLAY
ncbi:hypothetical protein BDV95DRAFT_143034 [Massariosphaeria phaeospora]|uniref:Uncharacterized protein n=1 Tax=Massariosphaeria phaeospora TaxID=100035 RepID=A0A7C8MMV9_9PLEO|nr:hypothetical protein BDV95DRAFT_143034 [Massariosphaeria phaeospora]